MGGWYERINGINQQPQYPQNSGITFQNPLQKANYIMQAMRNPAAFVKQHMPDIPDNILNDPNQVLQYMQQTRGITNADINRVAAQNPYPGW